MRSHMSYQDRLHAIQQILQESSSDALIVDDPINIYYMTGIEVSTGRLLIHSKAAHLIVDNRYFEICKQASPFPVLESDNPNFESRLSSPEFSFIHSLSFDSDNTSYKSYIQLQKVIETVASSSQNPRKITLIPLDNPIKKLRSVKDKSEIEVLKTAATLGSQGFDFVLTLLKEGITEIEIASELEIFWKRKGSKSLAFDPIIAFGPNSSKPHYRAGKMALKRGNIVLIDIGVNLHHYHSDMTRTVFFGDPNPKLKEIYAIVKEAQEAALSICKPGTPIGELDAAARNLITSRGYGPNFTHSLGHGVGLEIHELPVIKNTSPHKDIALVPGMVITIEPGIYLPGIGGVRIEDTIVINEIGYENLTNRSKDLVNLW